MLTAVKQKNLVARLNRIEGQVRGIRKMVQEPRYCPDILNQIAAVRRALDSVSLGMIETHMSTCVSTAIKKNKGEASIRELTRTIERFVR
jgi:CsoR family transcriptional regulator, copper-sensing transcriptional repressor